MTIDDVTIGRRLQSLRSERGLTQGELAASVGLDRSSLSRIEGGARSLTAAELANLATALRVNLVRLLDPGEDASGQDPRRVVIEGVDPEIDSGLFPVKRVVGERIVVEASIFADGHDSLSGVLKHRRAADEGWTEIPLEKLVNDRWRASFDLSELGRHFYTLEAWVDPFQSWRRDLEKRVAAGQEVAVDLQIGAEIIRHAALKARDSDRTGLLRWADKVTGATPEEAIGAALDQSLAVLIDRFTDRSGSTLYPKELEVVVDPPRALSGAWYELFPRSTAPEPGRHGTLTDLKSRLPYVAEMGFDVLYLPPIHPVGETNRKGPNNATPAAAGEPGSPWAIGSGAGGHKAVNPALGTLADFRSLVAEAKEHAIDLALDIAFQCSPDHPYVKAHPGWFRWRPDGKIQYAENPPKKYEDIFPLNFDCEDWQALWQELKSVFLFWVEQGVRIFRVDNPHTKPLRFWAWVISEVKREHPDVIFLAEAFTRPKIMYSLAKLGFSQSYTYFAWRNSSWELRDYLNELTKTEVKDYFRPNFWPNTPDILTEYLQFGGRTAFATRFILAATLGASYGIYGPAFELCEDQAREPGSEEYLGSEKYEIKHWDLDRPNSLRGLIARVNAIRRGNPALQTNDGLIFHECDNDQLICYSKQTSDLKNVILVVVNLDSHHAHSGWVNLDLGALGLAPDQTYQVHDLLSDARRIWTGGRNYVELDPRVASGHVFQLQRRVRHESDFDYYL